MSALSSIDTAAPERAWTDEQRLAIERRDGDLLLDAGAGSGKTSVLVERFVRSVLEDGLDPTAILAITFTEKAAAELRDRIRTRLAQRGAHDAARATEGAFISTIHGFCARVLRAHALAAGLDPRFTVLDRDRSEPLSREAFEDAIDQLAGEREGMVDLLAAYGAGPLRAAIVAVHAQLRSAGHEHPRLPVLPPPPDLDPATLRAAADEVASELDAVANPGPTVIEALAAVRACRELAGAGDVWPPDLAAAVLPRNGAALATDACGRYAERLDAFRAACAARAAAPIRDLLDALLDAYGHHYERRKRELSGVDFEDLELIGRRLLRDDAGLRERYAGRFTRVMVDELQDTNAVQLELIESIASGNLFTVGDAQQAIYGFRHARVELFERRGERLQALGARQTLRTNFRSRPEILTAIDLAFAGELGERHRPLVPGRERGGEEPRVELLLVDKAADWDDDGVASPWRLAEARTLADRLAELVAAGRAPGEIVVLLRATTDMRLYERALERPGLPTYVIGGRGYWAHPQVLDSVAYLRALANPRDEEALLGVLASPFAGVSIDGLVVVAAAARDSGRDPWWVLRESRDALDELNADDRFRVDTFVAWFAAERQRAPRSSLESLIDGALVHSGYDLTMLALPAGRRRLANVRKLMRLGREHERVNGQDLRGFLDEIEQRAAGGVGDPRESEAPVEGDGLDAIRLMTIHRAKGLEFPVVAVADLGRSARPPSELLRVGADGRIGIRLARAGAAGRESALDYKALGEQQQRAAEAEERRLLYVAVTRARERLILSGATRFDWLAGQTTSSGGGPVAWIAPAFVPDLGDVVQAGGGEVAREGTRISVRIGRPPAPGSPVSPAGATAASGSPASPTAATPAPGSPATPVPLPATPSAPATPPTTAPRPPAIATLSYSSLAEYGRCGYRFYVERVLGLPPPSEHGATTAPGGGGPRSLARSAADRGVLLHALLERLDFRRPVPPTPDAVRAAAAAAGLSPPVGPAEADELIALLRRFAAGELCARLGRAREVAREQRFAFTLGSDPGRPLLVGAIDVLAREPGGRTLVVDYKSDRLQRMAPAATVARSYVTQRLIYALAALRSGARAVEVVHCFLEAPEETVSETFEQADAPALEGRVEELQEGALSGRYAVSESPCVAVCGGCPAQGGLCSWSLEMCRRRSPDTLF